MIWLAVFPTLTILNVALGDWLRTLSPVLRQAGGPKHSARNCDPGAQDSEHRSDATRAPPLRRVSPGEVANSVEREQSYEDPRPHAEKIRCQRCWFDDCACGENQPKGAGEDDRCAGAGDPISGRQPTVNLRSSTPICGCAPWCSSGQCELEEDDDTEQAGSDQSNLDLGHDMIVADRGAESDPFAHISPDSRALSQIGFRPHAGVAGAALATGLRFTWTGAALRTDETTSRMA